MCRTNFEWVAQVSILRPGFLLEMGPNRNTHLFAPLGDLPPVQLALTVAGRGADV